MRIMKYKQYFESFIQALDKKLERGFHDYGDKSFSRPTNELLDELQQECLDLAGWGFILWVKIEELKKRST